LINENCLVLDKILRIQLALFQKFLNDPAGEE